MAYYEGVYSRKKTKHPHIRHAISRGKSRYGVGAPAVLRLEQMIQRQQGIRRSMRQSNTRTLHEVEMDGNRFYVVYSKSTNHVVTLLTHAMGRQQFGDDDTPRCICGAMLAEFLDGRRMCTIHPEILQETK